MPAEAEVVAQGIADITLLCLVECKVDTAVYGRVVIAVCMVDSGSNHMVDNGEYGYYRLYGTCAA